MFYVLSAVTVSIAVVLTTHFTGEVSQAALGFDSDAIFGFLRTISIIASIQAFFSALGAWLGGRFLGKANYRFRENFIRHFLRLPFSNLEKKSSGSTLSVYTNDLPKAAEFVADGGLMMISDIAAILVSFIYMTTVNSAFTLVFFAMFPILTFVQFKMSTPLQQKAQEMSVQTAKFNEIVSDSLQNTLVITSYGLEDTVQSRYLEAYDIYFNTVKSLITSRLILVIAGVILSMIPTLFVNISTGLSVISGSLSFAEFIAFTTVASTVGSWLTMLSQRIGHLRVTMASAVRLNDYINEDTEDLLLGSSIQEGDASFVSFKNVSFSYDGESYALKNVSFEIKSGENAAFVGGSGSGKSTVLKLLLGLYQAQSGTISIYGKNINNISIKSLRDYFSYIPQDCYLFPESIASNICCENIDMINLDEESRNNLIKASTDAGISDFINSLPEGYNTVLAESAENLSGGQKQRIAIARAFYKNSPAAIFDEATSALDPTTESEVVDSLSRHYKNRSLLMVTHRFKPISVCDKIVVLHEGAVSGIGKHQYLLENNALYSNLYAIWSAGETEGKE